jgi:hypothetical protein
MRHDCDQEVNAQLRDLCERLKMEAQSHAMEARGANDTIAKIYQIVTGARGEPGNWNAEVPVRKEFERLEKRNAALVEVLRSKPCPSDWRYTIGECQQCGCSEGLLVERDAG